MARKVKVDMTGVEAYVRCEEGEHLAVLKKIEEAVSQAGNDMLSATFEVISGRSTGARVLESFPLSEKAKWKLKGYLNAVGIKADGKISLDLDALEGKKCIISVYHEEYNGNLRAKIDEFKKIGTSDVEEDDDDEYEEEKPKKSAKKSKTPPPKDDDEDDDEEDWDEE